MDKENTELFANLKNMRHISTLRNLKIRDLILNFHRHINTEFYLENKSDSFWTMYIFIKGRFNYSVSDCEYEICENSVSYCFIPPYSDYVIKSFSAEIEYITLMFNMECFDNEKLIVPHTATSDLAVYFEYIRQNMLQKSKSEEENILKIIAYTLNKSLSENEETVYIKPMETVFARIAAIKTKISYVVEQNIFNPQLNVEFIAKQLYISTSYLYRCCIYNFGMSPSEYINDCKLKKACELIKLSENSFSDIAHTLNYCSQSYFSTRFKKKYGMSPLQYSRYINE